MRSFGTEMVLLIVVAFAVFPRPYSTSMTPTTDECIVVFHNMQLEYYHPDPDVECNTSRIKIKEEELPVTKSACYIAALRAIVIQTYGSSTVFWLANGSTTIPDKTQLENDIVYLLGRTAAPMGATCVSCGGLNSGKLFKHCVQFNTSATQWTPIASYPIGTANAATVSLGHSYYVIGGSKPENSLLGHKFVYRYDSADSKWHNESSMLVAREHHSAAALSDTEIITCGGYSGIYVQRTCEHFNASTGTWKSIASMTLPRATFGMVNFNGKIYAIGGKMDDSKGTFQVEYYNSTSNHWTMVKPLNISKGAVSAVVVSSPLTPKTASKVTSGSTSSQNTISRTSPLSTNSLTTTHAPATNTNTFATITTRSPPSSEPHFATTDHSTTNTYTTITGTPLSVEQPATSIAAVNQSNGTVSTTSEASKLDSVATTARTSSVADGAMTTTELVMGIWAAIICLVELAYIIVLVVRVTRWTRRLQRIEEAVERTLLLVDIGKTDIDNIRLLGALRDTPITVRDEMLLAQYDMMEDDEDSVSTKSDSDTRRKPRRRRHSGNHETTDDDETTID